VSRHVVIGTAGHVDHGKTALVRALTGVETDRWEEERRRGITIDLGFAPLALGDGLDASIVDVPGHEDFIRNMVAGATGVDLALLVVAADESVMPQTVEHVAILDFLGVRAGVVALAKADLVDATWLELVRNDVAERLATSRVAWQAIVPVSAVTGAGLDELRGALRGAAAELPDRATDDLFRLPVDRAFSVAGAGTVVTGTTWSGAARVGDEVVVWPGGLRARIRSVQVHGVSRPSAEPGRRTALALSGLERDAVARGSVVVAGAGWQESTRLDVMMTLLAGAPPLTQRSRVRVHLGTAEVLARVTPAAERIRPGETGAVRLRLEQPVVARWGDRAVVRSYSPITTIGGAQVADPWPPGRPRRPGGLERLLGSAEDRVLAAIERAGFQGLTVADLPVRLGIPPSHVASVLGRLGTGTAVRVGERLIAADRLTALSERAARLLTAHHRAEPLAPGMPREALRQALGDADLADHVLDTMALAGEVVVEGAVARLPEHAARLDETAQGVARTLENALREGGSEGRTAGELAEATGNSRRAAAVLEYMVRAGSVVRVGRERYYDAAVLERMVEQIAGVLRERSQVAPADLRDTFGLTRKFSIPLLEWLDGQGYTVRVGDVRRAGPRLTSTSEEP
jgi:selenocysteine-specific elongation factor